MNRIAKALIALSTTLLISNTSIAATADGTLGATSTGTADVTMSIGEQFQISNMAAFSFGSWSGSGDLSSNNDLCVYHNGDGSYKVTVSDDSTLSTGFAVENSTDSFEIPYSVAFNDETGTVNALAVVHSVATVAQSGANTTSVDCSVGGNSANLSVTIAEAELSAAPAGDYDSQITIMIDPD